MKKLLFTGISIAFLLTGCQEETAPVSENTPKLYFDIPGLVTSQIRKLNSEKPHFEKTVAIQHKKPETQKLQPADWNKELAHFLEIDLNKKALQDSYLITETISGNFKTTCYTLKPEVNAPVMLVEITSGKAGDLNKIKAVYEEDNALFFNREIRELTLDSGQKLQAYRISGVQKVLLFDSLRYDASARKR